MNWGSVDTSNLNKFVSNLEKMSKQEEIDKLNIMIIKNLAARFLRKVVKKTPVGKKQYEVLKDENGKIKKYKKGKNKGKAKLRVSHIGGTLRRGWTVGEVTKKGNVYQVEIFNPINYAEYVEYGHRQTPGRYVAAIGKRLKNSWVKGRFMMTISEQEVTYSHRLCFA